MHYLLYLTLQRAAISLVKNIIYSCFKGKAIVMHVMEMETSQTIYAEVAVVRDCIKTQACQTQ